MGLDEAIHIRGTGFGMVFLEMLEDLDPIDLIAGDCDISLKLERGSIGGPVIATLAADLSLGDMGLWSVELDPEDDAEIWPLDVVYAVAEYTTPAMVKIRQAKAIIHPYRSA